MKCPKCSHEWNYKGKSSLYVTCPNCYRKIHATSSESQKQQQPTTTQSLSLDEIDAARDEYVKRYFEEHGQICWGCVWDWQEVFFCQHCQAQFTTDRADARLCPACGSSDLVDYLEQGDSPVVKRLKKHDAETYGVNFEDKNSSTYIKKVIAETTKDFNKKLDRLNRKLAIAEKREGAGENLPEA